MGSVPIYSVYEARFLSSTRAPPPEHAGFGDDAQKGCAKVGESIVSLWNQGIFRLTRGPSGEHVFAIGNARGICPEDAL